MSFLESAFQQAFYLIVVLGALVFIHEFGHFIVAKAFGVRVEVFSLGFGKRLFGFRRGETDYRVALIPLGGYVKMAGEMFAESDHVEPDHFTAKPRWQRLLIVLAGPVMNMGLALFIWWALFMGGMGIPVSDGPPVIERVFEEGAAARAGLQEGDTILGIEDETFASAIDYVFFVVRHPGQELTYRVKRDGRELQIPVTIDEDPIHGIGFDGVWTQGVIVVASVVAGSPAAEAGLEPGDRLLAIDGQTPTMTQEVSEIIQAAGERAIEMSIERAGETLTLSLMPRLEEDGVPRIGISMMSMRATRRAEGMLDAFTASLDLARFNLFLLRDVLQGLVTRTLGPEVFSGPLEIARISKESAEAGPSAFFQLMAMISFQLGLFNLLPIPVLDGGQVLILLTEMAARRELPMRLKERVLQIGFILLIVFAVFVIANDVQKRFAIARQAAEQESSVQESQP